MPKRKSAPADDMTLEAPAEFDPIAWAAQKTTLNEAHPGRLMNARRDVQNSATMTDNAITTLAILGAYGDDATNKQVTALAAQLTTARQLIDAVLIALR